MGRSKDPCSVWQVDGAWRQWLMLRRGELLDDREHKLQRVACERRAFCKFVYVAVQFDRFEFTSNACGIFK